MLHSTTHDTIFAKNVISPSCKFRKPIIFSAFATLTKSSGFPKEMSHDKHIDVTYFSEHSSKDRVL